MGDYYVVAMNHIDMAFTMREEAHEEMLDVTLERVIGVLERHPELHFALEQAAHYRKLERRRPDLFQKVRQLLAEGRMEFLGGMATTAETNFPNGECLIRNQGMGLLWVREHLGTEPKVGWLVDTFGMNPQVPQIMSQFGFRHVYANRFGGDKRHDLFFARGLDGSRILVIGRDLASINVLPNSQAFGLCRNPGDVDRLFAEADALTGDVPRLVHYYIENEELFSEYYLRLVEERQTEGNWKHATYAEYSEALEAHGYEVPTLDGDLNPEFTGTFALRTPIKVGNRSAETGLLEAELWAALLGADAQESLEDCWWDLFFCQFHDVFTGSHEDITYRNVRNKFRGIHDVSARVLRQSLGMREAEDRIVCCNSLPWARREWVEIDPDTGRGFFAELPPCGVEEYALEMLPERGAEEYALESLPERTEELPGAGSSISNEYLTLVLDEKAGITLKDRAGTAYIAEAADFLVAQADYGGLQIERCEAEEVYAMTGSVRIGAAVASERGQSISMYGSFPRMPWNHGANRLDWEIQFLLQKGEKALRIKVLLDWEGQETRIRLRLPGALEGRDAFYEVPFGVVRREAYRNLPTAKGEWPAFRFAALEDGKRGLALINRGVAGVEQEGSSLVTTLIRAYGERDNPWIAPTKLTSQCGKSEFAFLVAPYEGNYRSADIIRKAQAFNQPVTCLKGTCEESAAGKSWFSIDRENIVLSAIKTAWDGSGDTVIRMYEAAGTAQTCCAEISGLQEACRSDATEKKGERLAHAGDKVTLEFAPYEIKTIRVRRILQ